MTRLLDNSVDVSDVMTRSKILSRAIFFIVFLSTDACDVTDMLHHPELFEYRQQAIVDESSLYTHSNSKICELENVGQGHDVQHSQWSHLMVNSNLCKSRI